MVDSSGLLACGTVFHGRYEIVRMVAAGGMGSVYEVVDQRTRRPRALKMILPSLAEDSDLRDRFELEATVTAGVESEHIVETFDAGIDSETGAPFIVMELLRGEGLDAMLRRRGRLPPAEVILLLDQAASALDRTHEAGIVHRDLKPSNMMLTRRDDGSVRLKILDFGIAKFVAQSTQSIKTTRTVGTPVYMAPEQIRGEGTIDQRADVYSMGQLAYALLVGEAYWETEARAAGSVYPVLMKVTQGATERPTLRASARGVTLPTRFDDWFARVTATDPKDRATGVGESVESLARVLGIAHESRRMASAPARDAPARPEGRPYIRLAAVGAFAVLAAGSVVIARRMNTQRAETLGAGTALAPKAEPPPIPSDGVVAASPEVAPDTSTRAEPSAATSPLLPVIPPVQRPQVPLPRRATAPAYSARAPLAPDASPSKRAIVEDPSDTR
jgi:hypothetical protein